jgi:hypothetical protein
MNTTAMLYGALAGDRALVAMLANYRAPGSALSAAAIFDEEAPDSFVFGAENARPCAVISPPTVDAPWATMTERGRAVTQAIRLYAWRSGSNVALDTAARRVRDLLHQRQHALTITGGRVIAASVTGPAQAPTSDRAVTGRLLTVSLELQEN